MTQTYSLQAEYDWSKTHPDNSCAKSFMSLASMYCTHQDVPTYELLLASAEDVRKEMKKESDAEKGAKFKLNWENKGWSSIAPNRLWSLGAAPDELAWVAHIDETHRIVVFKSIYTWYVESQEKRDGKWYEIWTKQMDMDLDKAKQYAESEAGR